MIAFLTGEIAVLTPADCIVDVDGVGYRCHIPFSTYRRLKEQSSPATLWTYTYVREDTLALYGFSTTKERDMFTRLIALNGVGPKVALCILSGLSVGDIVGAVEEQNVSVLSSVPGIGPKTAARIVFELKGKIEPSPDSDPRVTLRKDAVSALENLGYRSNQVIRVVDDILRRGEEADLESVLVRALRELSG